MISFAVSLGLLTVLPYLPSKLTKKSCSNLGYFDVVEGSCKCFDCQQGIDCAEAKRDCLLNTELGYPLLNEDYWHAHTEVSTLTPGYGHLNYMYEFDFGMYPRLVVAIRKLHKLVGHPVSDEHFIVPGNGAMELIHASHFALASMVGGQAKVWRPLPSFELGYRDNIMAHKSRSIIDVSYEKHPVPDIEVLIYPNSPDFKIRQKQTAAPFTIYDQVYCWPQFLTFNESSMPTADNQSVALFSLSKSLGLAGSRFGWAVTTNKDLAMSIWQFTDHMRFSFSVDTQTRAISALEHVIETKGILFHEGRAEMEQRWLRLEAVMRFKTLWKVTRPPGTSPAYAWLERIDDKNAYDILLSVGVLSGRGERFGGTLSNGLGSNFARVTVFHRQHHFNLLLDRLGRLSDTE